MSEPKPYDPEDMYADPDDWVPEDDYDYTDEEDIQS